MSWIWLALFGSVFKSGQNFSERATQRALGARIAALMIMLTSTIMIVPLVWGQPIPKFNWVSIAAMMASTGLYLMAKPMRLFALGNGEISQIAPLTSFTSLFGLILGFMIFGERPSVWGIVGVVLVVIGGAMVNIGVDGKFSLQMLRGKTFWFLTVSLILGSVINIFDKIAISSLTPRSPNYVLLVENLMALPFFVAMVRMRKTNFGGLAKIGNYKAILGTGLFFTLSNSFMFNALSEGYVGYVTAIKQTSIIFSILGGWLFLKEKGIKNRMIGGGVIMAGTILIGLLG